MTREQRLFEAASRFQDFIDFPALIQSMAIRGENPLFIAQMVEANIDLEKARNAYEGVPFSDGQEQDISPDAPHYNPKVSGRL